MDGLDGWVGWIGWLDWLDWPTDRPTDRLMNGWIEHLVHF